MPKFHYKLIKGDALHPNRVVWRVYSRDFPDHFQKDFETEVEAKEFIATITEGTP